MGGLITVRAAKAGQVYLDRLFDRVDRFQGSSIVFSSSHFQLTIVCQGYDRFYWGAVVRSYHKIGFLMLMHLQFHLRIRFDVIGSLAIAMLTIVGVVFRISDGLMAIGIVTAQTLVSAIHSLIWESAKLELE